MSSTQNILRAVQRQDFVTATKHFRAMMEAKLRKCVAKEYHDTAKTLLHPDAPKPKTDTVDEVGLGF